MGKCYINVLRLIHLEEGVTAATSHHCDACLNPGPGAICALSLCLVLILAVRAFPLSTKAKCKFTSCLLTLSLDKYSVV